MAAATGMGMAAETAMGMAAETAMGTVAAETVPALETLGRMTAVVDRARELEVAG
jgi:hypothetical protein